MNPEDYEVIRKWKADAIGIAEAIALAKSMGLGEFDIGRVRRWCREDRVICKNVGRDWILYRPSFLEVARTPPKPGRKAGR